MEANLLVRAQEDRRLESASVEHIVDWLQLTLGRKLTAFAAGVRSTSDLGRFAHGDSVPTRETETRLRNLYAVTWLLATRDGGGSAHTWLMEPNSELDGKAPAELLHDGAEPEKVWFAAAPVF
jgi:hypothetical protein